MSTLDSLNSPYRQYSQKRYFQSLDGVRFFSIVAVLWHHSFPADTSGFLLKGFLGVDMFFVLSGFLIVTLLLREKKLHKTIDLRGFYIRRCLRIFPVYFGLLIGLLFIYGFLKEDKQDFNQLLSLMPIYLFFVSNWSLINFPNLEIYWSLATEEQFYVLWPLLEKIFSRKNVLLFLVIFIFINQLINFGVLDNLITSLYGTEDALHLSILDSTFTPICLGVLLAHILHYENSYTIFHKFVKSPISPIVIFILLMVFIILAPADISGLPRLCIQLLMMFWLASLVVTEEHAFKPFMQLVLVKRIGQISYGMYVYHMFAIHIARVIVDRSGIEFDYSLFIFGTILTLVIAELSFRFYEAPILKLKKRFS